MSRTMAWRSEGRLNVVVHGTRSPTNLEWQSYLNEMQQEHRKGSRDLRVLVLSRGGGPDGAQRRAMTASLSAAKKPPVALLTDSALVRSLTTALRLFNPEMRSFATNELDGACKFLSLTPDERRRASSLLSELERQVDDTAPPAGRSR